MKAPKPLENKGFCPFRCAIKKHKGEIDVSKKQTIIPCFAAFLLVITVLTACSSNNTRRYKTILQSAFNEITLPYFSDSMPFDFDAIEQYLSPVNDALDYIVYIINLESLPDGRLQLNHVIQHDYFENILVEIYLEDDIGYIVSITYSLNLVDLGAQHRALRYDSVRRNSIRTYDTRNRNILLWTAHGTVNYFIRYGGAIFFDVSSRTFVGKTNSNQKVLAFCHDYYVDFYYYGNGTLFPGFEFMFSLTYTNDIMDNVRLLDYLLILNWQ